MIDGSVIRAHQHSSGSGKTHAMEALGRSRGGFSTKIHAKTDSFGLPLAIEISGGQESEIQFAERLIGEESCDYLLADKGYDSEKFRNALTERNIEPVIPSKINRLKPFHHDAHIYKERNFVERFFNKIKQFRRVATRYDKTAVMFKGTLVLVGIILWLKQL